MELTLMAHQTCGAPLVYTNGAPPSDAPLVLKLLMAHPAHGAPLVPIFFELVRLSKHTNGASTGGAPLLVVTSNGAPARRCATNVIFFIIAFIPFFATVLMAHRQGVRH